MINFSFSYTSNIYRNLTITICDRMPTQWLNCSLYKIKTTYYCTKHIIYHCIPQNMIYNVTRYTLTSIKYIRYGRFGSHSCLYHVVSTLCVDGLVKLTRCKAFGKYRPIMANEWTGCNFSVNCVIWYCDLNISHGSRINVSVWTNSFSQIT